jgi:orotate phosphoribosyltransferase
VAEEFGIPVISIANLEDLFTYLSEHSGDPALAQYKDAVAAYRARYGV